MQPVAKPFRVQQATNEEFWSGVLAFHRPHGLASRHAAMVRDLDELSTGSKICSARWRTTGTTTPSPVR